MVALDLTHLVDEIREKRLSRNRCFTLMNRGPYRAAMRLGRYLDNLARQILELNGQGTLQLRMLRPAPGRVRLRISVRHLRVERHCHLSEDELECMCRHHPDVRPLVASALSESSADTQPPGGTVR